MAEMEWEDEGWEDLIAEVRVETIEAAERAVFDASQHLRNSVVEKLTGNRSGRIYPVPGTSQATYRASAPGEPPASMLGKLRQNITASDPVVDGDTVSSQVGVDLEVVPYARRLELGGYSTAPNGRPVYIAPRPYLRPTFFEQEQNVLNILERAVGGR